MNVPQWAWRLLIVTALVTRTSSFSVHVHSGTGKGVGQPAAAFRADYLEHASTSRLRMTFSDWQHRIDSSSSSNPLESSENPFQDDEAAPAMMLTHGISSTQLREQAELEPRFADGDDLHALRQRVLALRDELEQARRNLQRMWGRQRQRQRRRNNNNNSAQTKLAAQVAMLEDEILQAQQRDAEFIYGVAAQRGQLAWQQGQHHLAAYYEQQAAEARAALPQFQLEGLWVGKYSQEYGFDMINVTYVGDTLVATKVTGQGNVPAGQVTFSVDLSPIQPDDSSSRMQTAALAPIELGHAAAAQWGAKYLSRFAGLGQVAAPDFSKSMHMEGQLILVDKYFSFAWLPISHQVFFGRPSPELVLKMMRQKAAAERQNDCDGDVTAHLERCWQETEMLEDDLEVSDGVFCSHDQAYYYDQEGCFE